MITAKVAKRPFLEIPEEVYDALKAKGEKRVKIQLFSERDKKKKLSKEEMLAKLDATQGIWADDEKIEEAFKYLEKKWAEWKPIEF